MRRFTPSQVESIGERSFVERVREVLLEQYPAEADVLNGPGFAPTVVQLARRAASYGLEDQQTACSFVITSWVLGLDFDEQFPELRTLLHRDDLVPAQKSIALETFTLEMLRRLNERAAVEPCAT